MAHFKKGTEVHLRGYDGQISRESLYRIRSCGKKQATLDYARTDSNGLTYYSSRGSNFHIMPIAEARAAYGENIPDYMKTSWDQHFVLAGVDGWDACEN